MSAGRSLPLPLDTCCSVSIVSEKQADRVATHHPHLRFTKLEQHVPVSVAGPNSKLWAVGIMQVPIVWENGRSVTFTMLVVPNLYAKLMLEFIQGILKSILQILHWVLQFCVKIRAQCLCSTRRKAKSPRRLLLPTLRVC